MTKKSIFLAFLATGQMGHCMLREERIQLTGTAINCIEYDSQRVQPEPNYGGIEEPITREKTFKPHKKCSPKRCIRCPKGRTCYEARFCCEKFCECPGACLSRIIDDYKPCGENSSEICCVATCATTITCLAGFVISAIIIGMA